ncbi:hypothetical protein VTN77DRAFT_1640 [Rasamsonia byssochlamydoides]|uniref:uncharacterized protein n=1 Tax=Rasamsonia byssochlamydoides TaxID=89139 RepID=UPI0037429E06
MAAAPATESKALPQIEVDVEATKDDSAYGDELSACATSLESSAFDYRHENGRRYHAYRDGSYLLPNDKAESERLDLIHEMMLTIMRRKLFLAPIGKSPKRVLDLGTGTGIWAIDFADNYPSAEVIGTDLSPTQPSFVPPNVRFIIDDMEQEWAFEKPFDFIHTRFLACSIKDYGRLLKQAFKNTVPGGWVECQDWDVNLYSEDGSLKGTSLEKYYKVVPEGFRKGGYVVSPGPQLEQWFREAGFEDIHVKKYKVPLGPWPKDKYYKEIGVWSLLQGETGFEAGAMAVLTRFESWSKEEVSVLVSKAQSDVRNRAIHSMFDCYVVYGKKPL